MTGTMVDAEDVAAMVAARAAAHEEAALETKEPVARVEDVLAGGVPARLYVPDGAPGVLLYLHGGGFALGDLVTHDGISRRLANRTGWAVLLVDYRRSPEHPWPAADADTAAAADWLVGQDFARRVVIGDSAGAALALGEALRHPTRYDAQVLVYPFVDPACDSYDRALAGVDLDLARCELFWRIYLQGADVSADPALHVLGRQSLAGLPPTLVQLAERDVLTPTGRLLADRLAASEVPTLLDVHPGVEHGFWRRTDNDRSEPALAEVARFLRTLP
jgi:acetyl esterase